MIGFVYDFSDPKALDKLEEKMKLINNTVKYKDEYYRKIEAQEAIQAKIKAEMI